MIGGGGGDWAHGQNLADQVRNDPGVSTRWDRGVWIRLALALIPLVVLIGAAALVALT